jgi:hypothetical protein
MSETSRVTADQTSIRQALTAAAARARIRAPEDVEPILEALTRLTTLVRSVGAPKAALWPAQVGPIPLTTQSAIEVADTVRLQLGFDDVNPLFSLASCLSERLNILVFSLELPRVESMCALFGGTPLIVVANDLGYKKLTVTARALGHLFATASRSKGEDEAHITPCAQDAAPRGGPREYFAANFALALLVPSRGLALALRRVRELLKVKNRALGDIEMLYLARIFGVSFGDITRACERAKLLPVDGAAAIVSFLTKQFGDAEQRAEALGLPQRPPVDVPMAPPAFLTDLKRYIDGGTILRTDAAVALKLTESALSAALTLRATDSKSLWQ